jgi:hypothetical protein
MFKVKRMFSINPSISNIVEHLVRIYYCQILRIVHLNQELRVIQGVFTCLGNILLSDFQFNYKSNSRIDSIERITLSKNEDMIFYKLYIRESMQYHLFFLEDR